MSTDKKPRRSKLSVRRERILACCDIWNLPCPDILEVPSGFEDEEADDEEITADTEYCTGGNKVAFEAIETMLGHMHKRQDPKILTDKLRLTFGSGNSLFKSDRYLWETVGVNHLDALFFSLIPELCRYTEYTSYGDHPRIGRLEEASQYLAANFIGLQDEHFYLFCVNMHGNMKARVLLHKGIEDRALVSIEHLMTELLRTEPAAFIVAHNHPNGTLRPSEADLQCTEDIITSASTLGIPLLDHVIVVRKQVVSMRDNGFIPECIWLEQAPNNHILKNWLQPARPKPEKKPKVLTPEEAAAAREKARQSARRKRLDTIQRARSQYRRHTKKAEKAMRVYQKLIAVESRDQGE